MIDGMIDLTIGTMLIEIGMSHRPALVVIATELLKTTMTSIKKIATRNPLVIMRTPANTKITKPQVRRIQINASISTSTRQ
jgi:hypothetical protein